MSVESIDNDDIAVEFNIKVTCAEQEQERNEIDIWDNNDNDNIDDTENKVD